MNRSAPCLGSHKKQTQRRHRHTIINNTLDRNNKYKEKFNGLTGICVMLCIHIAREKKEKYEKKKNDLRLSSTIQHNCKVWNCIIAQRTPNAIYNEKKKLKKKEKKQPPAPLALYRIANNSKNTHSWCAQVSMPGVRTVTVDVFHTIFYFCSFFIVFVSAHVGGTLVRKWAKRKDEIIPRFA